MHGYDRYMRIRYESIREGAFLHPSTVGGLLTRENTPEIFLHCR